MKCVAPEDTPFDRALWFIESHLADDIDLPAIADAARVSRYHLVRAFAAVAGVPVMKYVRRRRLAEAARLLALGAPDILRLALDAGYGSHEAFTRAFHTELGLTPDALRTRGGLLDLNLQEPIKMKEHELDASLPAPRIVETEAMLIAGLKSRYNDHTVAGIPQQWASFGALIGTFPQKGAFAFGVITGTDEEGEIEYTTGVEVSAKGDAPEALETVAIPARTYAVFSSSGHVSNIRQVWMTIYRKWLPELGLEHARAPDFERYGPAFDARTGTGGFEIWVPVDQK